MMMTRRYPRMSGAVCRGGAGLLLAGGVALLALNLERQHATHYGLVPLDLTPWLPSVLAYLIGLALTGASLGGRWYRHHRHIGGARFSRLDSALLSVGAMLVVLSAPTAFDLTLTPPATMTGGVEGIGRSTSPFDLVNQCDLAAAGDIFTVAQDVCSEISHSDSEQCVTVIFGPHSQIAFSVTFVPISDLSEQRRFCGE